MSRLQTRWIALSAACLLSVPVLAVALDNPSEMLPDPKQEARAEAIGAQLRCLVCQNESIEDSSAGLARDLRKVVREHVAKGESDRQVIDWMVARYGDFVRLSPPVTILTLLLWIMPALALVVGVIAAIVVFRRKTEVPPLDEAEQARLNELMNER